MVSGQLHLKIVQQLGQSSMVFLITIISNIGACLFLYKGVVLFEPEDFSWFAGENCLSTHETGEDSGIHFCSKCGSTPGDSYKGRFSWVTPGCIEGDPQLELSRHIFVGSKAAWETIAEGISQYEVLPPKNI